jgi:chemotaxis response regulator CheB
LKKPNLLLVFKDTLFKQILLSLLIEAHNKIEIIESTADNVDDLLGEVRIFDPDAVLLEKSSPLSDVPCLFRLFMVMPGRPVVLISQEHNFVHVVHWQTVQVETATDLIEAIRSD